MLCKCGAQTRAKDGICPGCRKEMEKVMSEKKFYKVVVTIELLMDEEPPENIELGSILYEMTEGRWSGVLSHEVDEMTPELMAKALVDQGSDPEFLGIDKDGKLVDRW